MSEMINLKIDGKEVQIEKGKTILEAARKVNVDIPTLCFLKEINEVGDCRICLVEVEGRRGYVPSCITKVEEGMVVRTNTPDLVESRKVILDLILSNHDRKCLTCTRNGNCELQTLAQKFNMDDIEYDGEKAEKPVDDLLKIGAKVTELSQDNPLLIVKEKSANSRSKKRKAVCQYTQDGVLLAVFPNVRTASDMTNTDRWCIYNCCREKRQTANGFIWRFKDEK